MFVMSGTASIGRVSKLYQPATATTAVMSRTKILLLTENRITRAMNPELFTPGVSFVDLVSMTVSRSAPSFEICHPQQRYSAHGYLVSSLDFWRTNPGDFGLSGSHL